MKEKVLSCPACTTGMKKFGDSSIDLVIDCCPKCQGLWFDGGELRQVFKSEGLSKRFLMDARVSGQAFSYSLSEGARRCPRCRTVMDQPIVGGVIVDVCHGCQGVWLDFGELRKIVDTYKKRGLKGDPVVVEQIREGLANNRLTGGLLVQALAFLGAALDRIFPGKS